MAKNKRKTITVTGIKKEEVKPGQALFLITSDRNDFVVRLASSVLTVTNTTENETLLNTFYRKDEEADMPTFENLCAEIERHNIFFDMKYFGATSVNFVTVEQPQTTPRAITHKGLAVLKNTADAMEIFIKELAVLESLKKECIDEETTSGIAKIDLASIMEPKLETGLVVARLDLLNSAIDINTKNRAALADIFAEYGLIYAEIKTEA